jgi:alkanesulfonate monooxygenase SsuD/methylene tetrahydromethanopterin reductase-like flavin-dependent oxidoreductase (luciferase family)
LDAELLAFLQGDTAELGGRYRDEWIVGPPEAVEQRLRAYLELGVTHFLFWFMDAPAESGMRLFAEVVAPRFK